MYFSFLCWARQGWALAWRGQQHQADTVPALTPASTGSPCKMVCPEAETRKEDTCEGKEEKPTDRT